MAKERKPFDRVKLIKTIDPVLQSVLLVLFVYSVDSGNDMYKFMFFCMLAVQVLSVLYNFFTPFRRKLKTERTLYLVSVVIWGITYYYIKTHVKEQFFTDRDLSMIAREGIYDFSLLAAGCILAGWYSLICFREIRGTIKRQVKDK